MNQSTPSPHALGRTVRGVGRLGCLVVLALLGLAGWADEVAAQGSLSFEHDGVQVDAHVLLRPAQLQSWAPITVTLTNRSAETRNIEIAVGQIHHGGPSRRLTWAVQLAGGGASKTQVLPAYVGGEDMIQLGMELREDGAVVYESTNEPLFVSRRRAFGNAFNVSRRSEIPYDKINALFVVGESPWLDTKMVKKAYQSAFLDSVYDVETPAEPIGVAQLPVAVEAYEAVDRIVLIGVGPEDVSELQRNALLRAIRGGRVAWIVPGRGGEGNGWVLPSPEYTVEKNTLTTPGPSDQAGSWDVFTAENDPGFPLAVETLSDSAGGSVELGLVRTYPYGLGHWRRVVACRGDHVPFELYLGWSRVTSVASPGDDGSLYRDDVSELGWIDEIHYRSEIPITLVFGLIVVYLLGIGPVLFWLLKRKGRLIWLLWVQPVIVVAFLVGTYTLGYLHFGAFTKSYHTLVVQQPISHSDGWGFGHSLATRYNPREGTVAVSTIDGTLPIFRQVTQRNPEVQWRFDDESRRLSSVELPEWSYSHFMTAGAVDLGGTLDVEIEFVSPPEDPSDFYEQITLTSSLPFTVHNPTCLLRERIVQFEMPITPGATVILDSKMLDSDRPDASGARTPPPIAHRLVDGLPRRMAQVLVRFDPEDLPGGRAAFVLSDEFEEQRGFLLVVDQP